MSDERIVIKHLTFTGEKAAQADLTFQEGVNVLYGASNTGKSLTVHAIDFMFGGSKPPPSDLREIQAYNKIWMGLQINEETPVTLMRATAGGSFELHPNLVRESIKGTNDIRTLSARHDRVNENNLSYYLLEKLGLLNKSIATKASGEKRGLSFRDITQLCIVDETSIQSTTSPFERGDTMTRTGERSVLKFFLTKIDDDAIVPVVDRKTFNAAKAAKMELYDDMIESISAELMADFPEPEELFNQLEHLEENYKNLRQTADNANNSIRDLFHQKHSIGQDIDAFNTRLEEIEINLERFTKLESIYQSDIERLESIEEVGFVLLLDGKQDCPLCGAVPEVQKHIHGLDDVEMTKKAAIIEIAKINQQQADLQISIEDLKEEKANITKQLPEIIKKINAIEDEIKLFSPHVSDAQNNLANILPIRDRVKHGIRLITERKSLSNKRDELSSIKAAGKTAQPQLGVSSLIAHDFAQEISRTLKLWHFPGDCHVAFDENTYDFKIDGKLRQNNGKGVRAVTHAAIKVSLLTYCRKHGLPHPCFLVLDTPLLTYRDPLNSKEGELSDDERVLAHSPLKKHFFEHLISLKNEGQFLIMENVDPPSFVLEKANVVVFSGQKNSKRAGLLWS